MAITCPRPDRHRRGGLPRGGPRLAIAALLVSALAAACAGVRSADDPPPPAPPGAATADSPRPLLTGELQAVEGAEITAPAADVWPMKVLWIIAEGTQVVRGQEVLQLDNSAVLSKLEEQKLAYVEASIRLRARGHELEAERAEKVHAVERARIELEKAVIEAEIPASMRARREHEEKQLALARARMALDGARRDAEAFEVAAASDLGVLLLEVSKAERAIRRAERSLDAFTIRAPRDGLLIYFDHPWRGRKIEDGDQAWPGMPLLKIPEMSRMEVIAWLADVDDGAVRVGQEATCTLDTYPDRAFPGRVKEVAPLAEEWPRGTGVRAYRVVVSLDRSDPEIMRPGMSVKVAIAGGEA